MFKVCGQEEGRQKGIPKPCCHFLCCNSNPLIPVSGASEAPPFSKHPASPVRDFSVPPQTLQPQPHISGAVPERSVASPAGRPAASPACSAGFGRLLLAAALAAPTDVPSYRCPAMCHHTGAHRCAIVPVLADVPSYQCRVMYHRTTTAALCTALERPRGGRLARPSRVRA